MIVIEECIFSPFFFLEPLSQALCGRALSWKTNITFTMSRTLRNVLPFDFLNDDQAVFFLLNSVAHASVMQWKKQM